MAQAATGIVRRLKISGIIISTTRHLQHSVSRVIENLVDLSHQDRLSRIRLRVKVAADKVDPVVFVCLGIWKRRTRHPNSVSA